MADFLASFNFGAAEEEPTREEACASLAEVQSRFRDVFEGKVTETRAEHMKTSIDIGPPTQFTIFNGDGHDVDPSLSRITAREAFVSQPQQNPVTQRAVSREILNAIGEIDGSTWSVIDELRKAQGWVLTYVCNHSWQQWTRHGKAAQTHAILDYSQKELDFMSRARPAFDCRGTVTITFSKTNSAITVNYSHTPLHRTVGEVYDLFKPPPPPPRAVSKKKAPGSAKKSDTPRRKRAATGADGAPAPKKPRSRPKKGAKNQLSQAELVPMTEGFASPNGATTAIDAADHVALAALSAATAEDPVPSSSAAPQQKNNTASLNVSPEEAVRRRETATNKLTEAGIDPATLNADQFSIFSNQSPEVQAESLKMLAKYGAERLHIVHPAKKDSPRPPASQPDADSMASGSVNPNRLANDSASDNFGPDNSAAETKGAPKKKTPQKAKAGAKSRVFCFNCKLSKSKASHENMQVKQSSNLVQCSKERPSCTVCQESGLTCEYPVAKPRNRKSAALVTEDEDTIMAENVDAEGEAEDAGAEDAIHTQAEDQRQPSAYSQVPIANMMQITPDEEGNGSRPIGEASVQPTYESRAPTSSLNWSSGGLALPQGRVYYPPAESAATKEPLPNNASTVVETTAPKRSQRVSKPTAKAKSRVPTPVQALIASPTRERHESPLERHNPMRHEAQPRNPLAFDRSPPNPYGQPATQPQYASDPYRQNPSYGQNQGAYPQLQETAPERIAYDPNAYRGNTSSRTFNQQKPPAPVHANAATGSWPSRGQDAAAADTLQRIHGYGGNSNSGNTMLSVHPPNQRRSTGGGGERVQGVTGASKHGSSRQSYSSEQQVPAAPNQSQTSQQSWYGFNGFHGGSTTNTQSNHSWGGSGGGGGWN
ncbi:hypothetical protein LLEC1_04844 [Akanthomyces lecanii]|uniref:Zn(2)-C6 fungal-type domain-containing protein n=1 Tax=Cordyceps confragosa TaxID=2714763 RepID=A0A179I2C4_CORDF|nr:hypothetical protein LLEC1_04844 [Akanthomyces lecanii]